MSDPVSAAVVGSMGAGVAGGGIKAFGDYYSGKAQSNQANYQAGIAAVNASIKRQDANYTQAAGNVESEQSGMRTRAQIGLTKAAYGAGNVSTASGSPSNVIGSEIKVGQQNQGIIQANAAKRAYGFNVAAAGDDATVGADEIAGKNSREAAGINMASTILGTSGSVSDKWLQASQSLDSPHPYTADSDTAIY